MPHHAGTGRVAQHGMPTFAHVALLAMLASLLVVASAEADAARRLEQRLLAPCCYKQTMDTHDSELNSTLRRELRARVAAGGAEALIEADFVRRFGERVRAVPLTSPLQSVALALMCVFVVAGFWLWRHARRLVAEPALEPSPALSEYDAVLERELRDES